VLLHFGTQSETADFLVPGDDGGGFPALPKLSQRMEKVNAHKGAKEGGNKGAHSEHKGEHKDAKAHKK
jgi:hypothetical protein